MHRLSLLAFITIASVASAPVTAAERKIGQRPLAGAESSVTVGSTLLERYNMVAEQAPRLRDDFAVSLGIQGRIVIPSNTAFNVSRASPLKACTVSQDTYIDHLAGPRGAACLYDTDMDGRFDRASSDAVMFTNKKLKEPVPYDVVDTPADSGSDYARHTLTYLGTAGGVLRISYREFSHDVARPAFTEELSFPIGGTYPQTISWRDTKITLLGLDGNGLRYRVEAAQ